MLEFRTISVVIGIFFTLTLGTAVYLNNPNRGPNRQFFFSSVLVAGYLTALGLTYHYGPSGNLEMMVILIRICIFTGACVFFSFNLLRHSIITPGKSIFELLLACPRYWIITSVALIGCLMPNFITLDTTSSSLAFNPIMGIGMHIANIALVIAGLSLIMALVSDICRFRGSQRVEFEYLMTGITTCIAMSVTLAIILPYVSQYENSLYLMPFSAVAMNAVIAYGIAAHRIMGVGEFLRKLVAYAMITGYLLGIYTAFTLMGGLIASVVPGYPSGLTPLAAALTMAFSLAPAHGFLQQFANRLFITNRPLDLPETLRDTDRVVQSLKPIDQLLEQFAAVVSNAVGTDGLQILLKDPGAGFRQNYPVPASSDPELLMDEKDQLILSLNSANSVISADMLRRMRATPAIQNLIRSMERCNAEVAVGIKTKGELQGVMLLGSRLSGRMYSGTDQEALQLLGSHLGVALENAQLYSQVQQSKVYNDRLLENLVSGVISVDPSGKIRTVNQEAQRIADVDFGNLGWASDSLPSPLYACLQETIDKGIGLRDREVNFERDGEEIILRVGTSIFHDSEGLLLGVILVFHDVTALRDLENQVRKNDRLASIGTMAAGMAHEIKNPLVAIKTFTQLLPERYDEEEFRDTFANLIGDEVTRIDTIVNRLLHFSRPAAPILSQVNLHKLVESLAQFLQHESRKRKVKITCELNAENDELRADANQIEQAFLNLMLNAMDAMEDGGELVVRTRQAAKGIAIEFADSGCGIPEKELDKVFDPFFTKKQNGTGLGLSVTHRIVEEHKGTIEVDSKVGEGTTFRMLFPTDLNEKDIAREGHDNLTEGVAVLQYAS